MLTDEQKLGPDDLVFASAGPWGIHYERCEPCQFGQHPGGLHPWAGSEDIAHAISIGKPESSNGKCGCYCTAQPVADDAPDGPDMDAVPLDLEPCVLCGELGACGYDNEGRPMIHVVDDEDSGLFLIAEPESDGGPR